MAYEKVTRSGTLLEHWHYERSPATPKGRARDRINPLKERYRKHARRRPDNIRRASSAFRRLVRANLVGAKNPALLTLTMLQELPLKSSSKLLTIFFARCRKRFGKQFKYIAVPEFQKRGAVHFHALIWNLPKEKISNERTTREIQRLWCAGFIDLIETDGSPKLAGYLSKYLSKSMSDIRIGGEKAYHTSRNILRPMSIGTHTLTDEIKSLLGLDETPTHLHKFKTDWLGQCTYTCYHIDEPKYDIQNNNNFPFTGDPDRSIDDGFPERI